MNQTLKAALASVERLSDADQEDIAREVLRLAEEKRIDAKLAAAEASGEPIPLEEAFENVRRRIRETHGL